MTSPNKFYIVRGSSTCPFSQTQEDVLKQNASNIQAFENEGVRIYDSITFVECDHETQRGRDWCQQLTAYPTISECKRDTNGNVQCTNEIGVKKDFESKHD